MNRIYEEIIEQAKWEIAETIWKRGIDNITPNVVKGCLGKSYAKQIGGRAGYNEFRQMYRKLMHTDLSHLVGRAGMYN